jgi:type IV secretion system protein TrbL
MAGCSGWDTVNPACQLGQVASGAASTVGDDIFGAIAHHFADAASSMVGWLWTQLNAATSIDLTSADIKSDLIATGAIAGLVAFALFLIQVIASVLRQDPGGLGRAVRGLGVAFIGAAFAVATTQVMLAAVDALCNGVVQFAVGTDMSGLGTKLITASTLSSIGNPAGLLLLSLVLIGAVVVVWVALMIRKMLIVISAVFAPIAFSGAASDISRSWVRRWIEFTAALVFSKLILVIIFLIGLSVLNGASSTGAGTTQTISNLAVGTLTLLLAGFAPWIAIKMVHFAGDSLHAVHAQAATAAAGAQTLVAAPQKAMSVVPRPQSSIPSARPAPGGSASGGSSGQPKSSPTSSPGTSGAAGGSTAIPAAGLALAAAPAAWSGTTRHVTSGIEAGEQGGHEQVTSRPAHGQ